MLATAMLMLVSCTRTTSPEDGTEYETAMFSSPDSTLTSRTNLCEVRYYVNADTLFTNEKYFFVSLTFSDDNDADKHYDQFVFFDKSQQPNKDGWFHIIFDRKDIYREPNSHVSAIVLRSYMGDKYDYANPKLPHADAYLYNTTDYIAAGRYRNELTPQLSKLLPIIQ